ncbi:MAG: amidohydrolase family protein [Candidatus Aenigmatarchaeota archaeon]
MKIIDCHTHPLFQDKELQEFAKRAGVKFSLDGLIKEMKESKIEEKCKKIYEIAEKNNKPVIIHTGDPFYNFAKIKYTHPIHIDDIAVEHPNLKVIIAHTGNPWIEDAVEIAYKNENVYLDISGWFFKNIPKDYGKIMIQRLKFILSYLETSDKILFGTDWPLIRMKKYVDFVKNSGINKNEIKKIMYKNALNLFW